MTKEARAAIIVPHYRDPERLDRCLASLVGQATRDIEICVVDNASGIDLSPIAGKYPGVSFTSEDKSGAGMARNKGVSETSGDILLFIDADCVAAPDWVSHAMANAEKSDIIGGRVDTFDETPAPRSGAEAFEAVFAFNMRSYIEEKGFCGSGNLLTTRDIFTKVGGFASGISEDVEWSQRAISKGCEVIYDDQLVVSHPTRRDWPALRGKWLRTTQEAFLLSRNRGHSSIGWLLRAGAVAASPFIHAPKLLFSKKLDSVAERLRGLATLFRLRFARSWWMVKQFLGLQLI